MPDSGLTLLIVESPVVAKTIENMNLPAIDVMSSGGFAWKPTFNYEDNSLKALADPQKRAFRNALREKAKWAVRIIIATDPDPSGYFIAHSIRKMLNSTPALFTHFDYLNQSHIRERLETATHAPLYSDALLNKYFTVYQELSHSIKIRFGNNYSVSDIISIAVLSTPLLHTIWRDENRELYFSQKPIQVLLSDSITISPLTDPIQQYKIPVSPPSLSHVLEPIDGSWQKGYQHICELFQHPVEAFGQAIISYPRTAAVSWPQEIWEQLFVEFRKLNPYAIITPKDMRNISDRHERAAIHITNPEITPKKVRPHVKKVLYDLYAKIYDKTEQAICISIDKEDMKGVHKQTGIYFNSTTQQMPHRPIDVHPVLSAQYFMQECMNTRWVKASKIAPVMDRLLSKEIITCEQASPFPVYLSQHLDSMVSEADALHLLHFFRSLNDDIYDESYSADKLCQRIRITLKV